ncbi:hypothetical protein, partial [Pseudomonas syringae]|uniref:hypothetical protein n=1 Tax=Pseudomonas syringae TaxID=317 RepID=UPI000A918C57
MQTKGFLDLTSYLITSPFRRIFSGESANLSWGLTQAVSKMGKPELLITQNAFEVCSLVSEIFIPRILLGLTPKEGLK